MAKRRGTIGKQRREQIVEAAVAIIAEQGLQHVTLSAIEERASMSRGQLTYYFPAKEDILLAVFDRLIEMMHRAEPSGNPPAECGAGEVGWERLQGLLAFLIVGQPQSPEFYALQYTFLSQIGHRDDFRQRLASLYEHWRSMGAADFALEMPAPLDRPTVSPRTLASFLQAVLHGLAIQRVADPNSFDPHEMLTLTVHLLGSYLGKQSPSNDGKPDRKPKPTRQSRSRKKE